MFNILRALHSSHARSEEREIEIERRGKGEGSGHESKLFPVHDINEFLLIEKLSSSTRLKQVNP